MSFLVGVNLVFIYCAFSYALYKTFPNAGAVPARVKFVAFTVPEIEITNYLNLTGIGSPNSKESPFFAFIFDDMRSQLFV